MHDLGRLALVSFSLGLSNFAAAVGIGVSGADKKTRLKTAVAFGLFEAAMPLLGLFIGKHFAGSLGKWGHYLGATLLILTGVYSLWKAHKGNKSTQGEKRHFDFKYLLFTGFALSIDNLVVGFALSLYKMSVLVAALVIVVETKRKSGASDPLSRAM